MKRGGSHHVGENALLKTPRPVKGRQRIAHYQAGGKEARRPTAEKPFPSCEGRGPGAWQGRGNHDLA